MHNQIIEIPIIKRIGLVAHDMKKTELLNWVKEHFNELKNHKLFATGTTGRLIEDLLDVPVHRFLSGPLGGDQQIGAHIAQAELDMLIFLWDPMAMQAHDTDVKALLRIASVWNIPVAYDIATADFMITSTFMQKVYKRQIPDYSEYLSRKIN